MIKEYEIVKSLVDFNDKVLTGCKGTVLIVYDDEPLAYEVEFVDDDNRTLDVLTVNASKVDIL